MRLRVEKSCSRFPGGKLPILLYMGILAGYLFLQILLEGAFKLCWFKVLTGLNCPSCGLSRAFFALFSGHPLQALKLNPFMLIFSLVIFAQFFLQIFFKRSISLQATPKERNILYISLGALFILNWIYLLFFLP